MPMPNRKPEGRESRANGHIEARFAAGETQLRQIVGYAAMFNSETVIYGMWREVIAPGAFSAAIAAGQDVRALVNHDENLVLGRTTAKTLVLSEDTRGLQVEITPPDTQAGRDIIVSLDRGDIDQMSFAFVATSERWDEPLDGIGLPLRTVITADLYDVSVVTYPAYEDTEVGLRSLNAWRGPPAAAPTVIDLNAPHHVRRRMALRDAERRLQSRTA